MTISRRSVIVVLLALAAGCNRQTPTIPEASVPAEPEWFEDVTEKRGLKFAHDCGPITPSYFFPQHAGSGCAFFDFDGDGLLDIYLIHNGGPGGARNQLFQQQRGGTFRDVSAGSGLDVAGYATGVAIADVNNDGLPDVLLTEYGATRLFLNKGGGRFVEITREAGLDNPLWATSAAFFDFDRGICRQRFVWESTASAPANCWTEPGRKKSRARSKRPNETAFAVRGSLALLQGHLVIVQRPLLHKADTRGAYSVDDQSRVVDRAEILAQQRIGVPDLLQQDWIGKDLGDTRQANLVVMIVEVAQLHLRIVGNFHGLVVVAQVGDVNDEAVRAHRRHGTQARLVAVHAREVREAVGADHSQGTFQQLGRLKGLADRFCHEAACAFSLAKVRS
jgi:hypothetical protein